MEDCVFSFSSCSLYIFEHKCYKSAFKWDPELRAKHFNSFTYTSIFLYEVKQTRE